MTPNSPPRRFPRWLIVVLTLAGLSTLAVCGVVALGILTLLGSKVTPVATVSKGGAAAQVLYDPKANPKADIAAALKAAKADHKRVLLDFGADWCPDCLVLSQLFDDPKVKSFLEAHYHVVRIDVGRWDNHLDTAKQYGNPIENGIPAVVILDANETLITSTAGGELANARTATAQQILAYLQQWADAD